MVNLLHSIAWTLMGLKLSKCNNFIPIIPEQCLDQNICEDVANYPHEYMDGIIKELEEQDYNFQSDGDSVVTLSKQNEQQSGDHIEIVDICPSVTKTATPLAAKDETGQWHFVINQKEHVVQYMIEEVCNTDVVNKTCGENLWNTAIHVKPRGGYSLLCRQEHLKRVLGCLDDEGKVVNKAIQAASCCSCAVQHSNDDL